MKKLMVLIFLAATSTQANCLKTETVILGAERVYQNCRMSEALEIATGYFYYPNISINELQIEYWKGSFERENLYQVHYQEVVTNTCTQKEVSRKDHQMMDRDFDEFKMKNPNLDPELSESAQTQPQTREEATMAFAKLKADCESAVSK